MTTRILKLSPIVFALGFAACGATGADVDVTTYEFIENVMEEYGYQAVIPARGDFRPGAIVNASNGAIWKEGDVAERILRVTMSPEEKAAMVTRFNTSNHYSISASADLLALGGIRTGIAQTLTSKNASRFSVTFSDAYIQKFEERQLDDFVKSLPEMDLQALCNGYAVVVEALKVEGFSATFYDEKGIELSLAPQFLQDALGINVTLETGTSKSYALSSSSPVYLGVKFKKFDIGGTLSGISLPRRLLIGARRSAAFSDLDRTLSGEAQGNQGRSGMGSNMEGAMSELDNAVGNGN
ncbi:MAG: hypothetical protein NUW37_07395 [Planctomycetes bacterium]|nr:hypothetical protein [Planctomycetota bacterium]